MTLVASMRVCSMATSASATAVALASRTDSAVSTALREARAGSTQVSARASQHCRRSSIGGGELTAHVVGRVHGARDHSHTDGCCTMYDSKHGREHSLCSVVAAFFPRRRRTSRPPPTQLWTSAWRRWRWRWQLASPPLCVSSAAWPSAASPACAPRSARARPIPLQ